MMIKRKLHEQNFSKLQLMLSRKSFVLIQWVIQWVMPLMIRLMSMICHSKMMNIISPYLSVDIEKASRAAYSDYQTNVV